MLPRDQLIAALKRLCEAHGGHVAVADAAGVNDQTIWQIISGTRLPSGEPRGVGPSVARRLEAAFPGWASYQIAKETPANCGAGTRSQRDTGEIDVEKTLRDLGLLLARLPHNQRGAACDNLVGLARDGGALHWQTLLAALLQAPSAKNAA
jgi:hypothetical protein